MAKTAKKAEDDAIPLIEEVVDAGLGPLLENYRPAYTPGGSTPDELEEHFKFFPGQPIPELSHDYAKAYEATDLSNSARKVYAMVCEPNLPYRTKAAVALEGLPNAFVTTPLASGTVRCSQLNESRFVLFFERAPGTRLSDLLAKQMKIPDGKIVELILRPICNALIAMREKGIHHGNLHPGMITIGENTIIGECCTAPAGTLGHYLYEPLERLMADALGHGEANEKADMYALGIIIFELMFGLDKLRALPRQEYMQRLMRQGVYHAFSQGRDFQEPFQDFFRGVLTENTADRWGLDQLMQYISGKRFNMVAPGTPKDASRPFIFGTENIFSRRVLANALHRNWRDAVRDIRSLRLDRWCELSLHRPELAERIERAMRVGSDPSASERQVSDMMMRIFAILDPTGPLRTKSLSVRPDAIGITLASIIQHKGPELQQLLSMIQTNICIFWAEQSDQNKSPEMSQVIWHLQRMRTYLEVRALGFGIERVLYELNPSLPCQSPLLKPYHVTTVQDALLTLDTLARTIGPNGSLVDRHLAAFIAAKIDVSKEIRLGDYTSIPSIAENPELVMLWLLSKAQQRNQKLKLVGLCAWAGMRIEKMLDQVHNRVARKKQKLQLKKLVSGGVIRDVVMSILSRDVIAHDTDGFAHAIALYDIHHKRIEYLQTPMILEYKARKTGGRMAVRISYSVLLVMSYITVSQLVGH